MLKYLAAALMLCSVATMAHADTWQVLWNHSMIGGRGSYTRSTISEWQRVPAACEKEFRDANVAQSGPWRAIFFACQAAH